MRFFVTMVVLAGKFELVSEWTAIRFTMSLFIEGLAFDGSPVDSAELGILTGSAIAATIGMLMLLVLTLRAGRATPP